MKTKKYKQFKKELLKDRKIKKAYEDLSPEFQEINQKKQNQELRGQTPHSSIL
jgi:hypothetical protein